MKPKLLDLFCGAGGAAMGYHWPGFEVVGVDIARQKHYPFDFVQADALDYCATYGHEFDAIHASPPCQAHSIITPVTSKSLHVDLIPDTRQHFQRLNLPYVIENVGGARRALTNPLMLCGAQFGLKVYRHRFFESNVFMFNPEHQPHRDNTPRAGHGTSDKGFISVTSGGNIITVPDHRASQQSADFRGHLSGTRGISEKGFVSVCGNFSGIAYCKWAMGIDWMTQRELAQAIPPAYTEYLGRQLMSYVVSGAIA
jgi:DNA (cytosine-5)-methyltransferase 1